MSYKIKIGQGRWLLRRLLSRYIYKSRRYKSIMNFGVSLARWLRWPLRASADSLLAEGELQEGYLNPALIHAAGKTS